MRSNMLNRRPPMLKDPSLGLRSPSRAWWWCVSHMQWRLLLLVMLFSSQPLLAQSTPTTLPQTQVVVTQVRPANGQAWRTPHQQATRLPLVVQQTLAPQDLVTTGAETWVQLLFRPACQVWIAPNSRVLIRNLQHNTDGGQLELLVGKVRATVGSLLGLSEEHFSITAESVFAAPRGTDFIAERTVSNQLEVTVLEGVVEVGNQAGDRAMVSPGQTMLVSLMGPLAPAVSTIGVEERRRATTQPGFVVRTPSMPPVVLEFSENGHSSGGSSDGSSLAPPVAIPPIRPWTVELKP